MKCIVCDADGAHYRCRHCRSPYCSTACFKAHRTEFTNPDIAAETNACGASPPLSSTSLPSAQSTASDNVREMSNCHRIQKEQQSDCLARAALEAQRQRQDPFSDVSLAAAISRSPDDAVSVPSDEKKSNNNNNNNNPSNSITSTTSIISIPTTANPCKRAREEAEGNEDAETSDLTAEEPRDVEKTTERKKEKEGEEEEEEEALTILKEAHLHALASAKDIRQALKDPSLQKLLQTIDQSQSRLDALEAALYNNSDFKHFCDRIKDVVATVEQSRRGAPWTARH